MADLSILDPYSAFTIPLDDWVDAALTWLVANFRPFFQSIRWPVSQVLTGIEAGLIAVPPLIMTILIGLLGWQVAGARMGLFSLIAIAVVGFLGIWEEMIISLALVLTAVVFCILIGVPLGILAARSDRMEQAIRPVLDAMQTTPAFVYLVPVVMLFGIGNVPGIIVTIIFALPPLIRLTNLGIRQVPSDVIEASIAFGASPRQLLLKVQLPLALRTIMAGINQTLMLSLSMVVIASMIAVGGLGQMVLRGIGRLDMGLATVGGVGIVLLAIVLDRLTQAMGKSPKERGWQSVWDVGPLAIVAAGYARFRGAPPVEVDPPATPSPKAGKAR